MQRQLDLGTVLLRKYRVDRFRLETGGVGVYDATDTLHARRVSVSVADSFDRLHADAYAWNVVDVGKAAGVPFVVTAEPGATPMVRPSSRPPPPLPLRAKPSQPSARSATDDSPAIPIFEEDEEAVVVAEPRATSEQLFFWMLLLVVVSALTALGGYWMGYQQCPR